MPIEVVILEYTQIEYTVYKLSALNCTQNFNEDNYQSLKKKQEQVCRTLGGKIAFKIRSEYLINHSTKECFTFL